jgi:hypothetical protein
LNLQVLIGWLLRLVPPGILGDKPFQLDQHFRQTRGGVQTPAGWRDAASASEGVLWVLSRACYVVRFLDLAAVPAAKRDAAIRLAAAGWLPYPETAHYAIPDGERVLLCAWDAGDVARQFSEVGLSPDRLTIIPEAALRDSSDMLVGALSRIEKALDGVVGCIVLGKHRAAEQWWPDLPSADHWRNFLRSAGAEVTDTEALPVVQDTAWRSKPAGFALGAPPATASASEQLAVWIAALLLAVPSLWYLNDLRQVEMLKAATAARLATTEKELDAVLSARESALETQSRAMKLAGLVSPADPIQLFAIINEVLGQIKGQAALQLSDWELRGGALKFTLIASSGAPPAPTTLVKAFEKVESFRDVEAKSDGTRVSVSMRVVTPPVPLANPTIEVPLGQGAKS